MFSLTVSALENKWSIHHFTYWSAYVCEALNLAQNPFSSWLRLRLGHGACMLKILSFIRMFLL